MNKDLFALVPNTFEPSLNENYEGIETFLELEYQGQMTAELKKALAEKNQITVIPKLLTSIAMATVLFLAACTPASSASADNQQAVPYAEDTSSFVIKTNHCWKERLSVRHSLDSSSFTAF